jgi:hypothetical protein
MEPYRDLSVTGDKKYLRYAHYDRNGEPCYMISNENRRAASVVLGLRGFCGGCYTVWDAFENRAESRVSEDGRIPLTVEPNNLLVLFPGSDLEYEGRRIPCAPVAQTYEPRMTWRIELCEESALPSYEPYKTVTKLNSITAADEMPSFSGNMRYTATVTLDPTRHTALDLGTVGQTAEVRVNGKHVGTRIFSPYRFDISHAVKAGENTVEVIVANTCVHEQRDPFSRFMLIKPSGLLGPVKFYAD